MRYAFRALAKAPVFGTVAVSNTGVFTMLDLALLGLRPVRHPSAARVQLSRKTIRWSSSGIRMALGACARDILLLVVREVLMLVGAGVAIGLPAAFAVTRLLASQLYGIAPHDPVVIILGTLG